MSCNAAYWTSFCLQLAQAIRAARAAKERGRELQERGALESDVFLLFSNKYVLEGDSVDQEYGKLLHPSFFCAHPPLHLLGQCILV